MNEIQMFGSDEEVRTQIPTQAQSLVEGSGAVMVSEYKPAPDVDYLQELLAIQQQGPRAIGFFGTRNMGFMHQELIEILSYALVITKNHIFTSGASGTNAAVIRGALRAEKPELLTVILPQSLKKQSPESQELLSKVRIGGSHKLLYFCVFTCSRPFCIYVIFFYMAFDSFLCSCSILLLKASNQSFCFYNCYLLMAEVKSLNAYGFPLSKGLRLGINQTFSPKHNPTQKDKKIRGQYNLI
ncbi:uncharacterized protein LOC111379653 isoform X2 [Olea europaea var. sylvestris]|nr:uncharacterized protein LOC111379653 isoform X2 [Olea europaea var. sylvestris]